MPNSLDVAKQRKLLEELQRDGQNTQDAESRLRDMLDVITSMHRSNAAGTTSSLRHKENRPA
jgi:hypothetical protein